MGEVDPSLIKDYRKCNPCQSLANCPKWVLSLVDTYWRVNRRNCVVYVNGLFTQNAAAQASAGMFAFGDLLLFIGTFGFLALIPTGLVVYFLIRKLTTR